MKKLLAGVGATAVAVLAVPATASADTGKPQCTVVHDHIAKTDNGHGTPAEWADLSLNRTTTVCGNSVKLVDKGTLWTRPGAGTPNGTGGQITNRVPGLVYGIYKLTVSGGTLAHKHGDVTLPSTEYVKSLFSEGTTVTGGPYAWAYRTVCGEVWIDSSENNDGQGAQAGNITGKRCAKPPTPTPGPTGPPAPTPTSPGGQSTPTVPVGAPQTGDGTSGGGNAGLVAAGSLVCMVGVGGGLLMWRRRRQD